MDLYVMKISVIMTFLLLASCSANYYKTTIEDKFSTVSFSNLTPEIPDVYLIDKCETYKIENQYIERKYPTDKPSKMLRIPVKRKITFEYNILWISGEKKQLENNGGLYTPNIEEQTSKTGSTCTETVTFIPEEGKHYEVYFGKSGNKCVIGASEVELGSENKINKLIKLNALHRDKC